jgi:hypothetical protein
MDTVRASNDFKLEILPTKNAQNELWLRTVITIDGTELFPNDCVEIVQLVASLYEPSGYFIFTCSCGEPGCAGWFQPVRVTHDFDQVLWNTARGHNEFHWRFSKRQMYTQVLCELEKVFPKLSYSVQYGWLNLDHEQTDLSEITKRLEQLRANPIQ